MAENTTFSALCRKPFNLPGIQVFSQLLPTFHILTSIPRFQYHFTHIYLFNWTLGLVHLSITKYFLCFYSLLQTLGIIGRTLEKVLNHSPTARDPIPFLLFSQQSRVFVTENRNTESIL